MQVVGVLLGALWGCNSGKPSENEELQHVGDCKEIRLYILGNSLMYA